MAGDWLLGDLNSGKSWGRRPKSCELGAQWWNGGIISPSQFNVLHYVRKILNTYRDMQHCTLSMKYITYNLISRSELELEIFIVITFNM